MRRLSSIAATALASTLVVAAAQLEAVPGARFERRHETAVPPPFTIVSAFGSIGPSRMP